MAARVITTNELTLCCPRIAHPSWPDPDPAIQDSLNRDARFGSVGVILPQTRRLAALGQKQPVALLSQLRILDQFPGDGETITARVRESVSHQNLLSSFRRAKYTDIGHAQRPIKAVIGRVPYIGLGPISVAATTLKPSMYSPTVCLPFNG